MLIQPLPVSFNPANEITPPVYPDHFMFAEVLSGPYEAPGHPAGIGLLITGLGTCDYYVNGTKNEVAGDKVLFVNRGSELIVRITGKGVAPALLFFHSGFPDLIQHSLNYGDEVLLDKPFDSLPYDFSYLERIHADSRLHQTLLSLIGLGASCSSFASLRADIIIRDLFEELLKKNNHAYLLSKNIQALKASTRLEIFKRVSMAKDWMEQHYNEGILLEDIAEHATMNSQHFLRMFKQVYQITPHQYMMDLKLKKAKQLLEGTDLSVNDICLSVGFESVFSFSLLFKKRFGQSPSRARKPE